MGIGGQPLKRAVFLDRDGVVNEAIVRDGRPYPPRTLDETIVPAEVPSALDKLIHAGFVLGVVTNQPDVARGRQSREQVEAINAYLAERLPIGYFAVCYHDEADGCACRKPKPGLLLLAAQALGADPEASFMVGDRWRDVEAGSAAGCRTVWVDRAYAERAPANCDFRTDSLRAAVEWILVQPERRERH